MTITAFFEDKFGLSKKDILVAKLLEESLSHENIDVASDELTQQEINRIKELTTQAERIADIIFK